MRVAAFLPAKGQSDRVNNKNISLLDGQPLFLRSLEKLINCDQVDEVFLDTESPEIIRLANDIDCRILRRDPSLSSNNTDGNALFVNEANHTDADICVQLLCTSPFIRPETINQAISILKNNPEYDSVIAVKKEKLYQWQDGLPSYDIQHIPNSASLPDTVVETMGLYVMRRDAVLSLGRRIGDHPYLLEMTPLEAIDVNYPADFEHANLVAVGLREQERRLFNNIKSLLTSPVLSDVLDDLEIEGVLSSKFSINIPGMKLFGRAKTLQIDPCHDDADYKKIYDSLNLYDQVVSNDIIVVANRSPEYAFFGGLNANLAVRSGAVGAIIDGVTRDLHETTALGFPVVSKGNYCKDTRRRGIVSAKNKPVIIDGVRIRRDDLIFADADGVVVIPRDQERKILDLALSVYKKEHDMLVDIACDMKTDSLITKYGFF